MNHLLSQGGKIQKICKWIHTFLQSWQTSLGKYKLCTRAERCEICREPPLYSIILYFNTFVRILYNNVFCIWFWNELFFMFNFIYILQIQVYRDKLHKKIPKNERICSFFGLIQLICAVFYDIIYVLLNSRENNTFISSQ